MHQNREWRRKALPKAPKNGAGGSLDLSPPTPNPSICIPAASASMLRPRPALMTADVIHPSPEPRKEPQGSRYSALLQGKGFNIHFLALHKPERGVSPRLQRARRDCQPRALAKVRKEPGSAEGKAPSFQNRKRRRVGVALCLFCPALFSSGHKHQKLSAPKKRPPHGLVRACTRSGGSGARAPTAAMPRNEKRWK